MKTLAVIPAVILSLFALTTSNTDYSDHPLSTVDIKETPVLIESELEVPHLRNEESSFELETPRVALQESEDNIPFLQAEEELALADHINLFETELEVPNLQEEEEIENADLIFDHVELVEMDIPEPEAEEEEEMKFD